jgi:large subunit ribosomal protein L22
MDYRYGYIAKENMAKAVTRNMDISAKHAVEVCSAIRGKTLAKARRILDDVINMKRPVKFRRYCLNVGHKAKMGPGRYPVKAAGVILKLLDGVAANAQMKGLATGKLEICHISAQCGSKVPIRGKYGRMSKNTNVEVVVRELSKEDQAGMAKNKETKHVPAQQAKKEQK